MYYIFDLERNMFWKMNRLGYSNQLKEAGLYSKEEAEDIKRDGNIVEKTTEIYHKDSDLSEIGH